MTQVNKDATVNATVVGSIFTQEYKIFIILFFLFSDVAKRGVEFCHSRQCLQNLLQSMERKCLTENGMSFHYLSKFSLLCVRYTAYSTKNNINYNISYSKPLLLYTILSIQPYKFTTESDVFVIKIINNLLNVANVTCW